MLVRLETRIKAAQDGGIFIAILLDYSGMGKGWV
jgi:hypothetical protein